MKNVLIIASTFPPIGGVSVQRTSKIAKYLPSFGWTPIVLTIKRDRFTQLFMPIDVPLGYKVNTNVEIYEAGCYYWLIPLLPLAYAAEKDSAGNNFCKFLRAKFIFKFIVNNLMRLIAPDIAVGWYPLAVKKGKEIIEKHNIEMLYSTSPSIVAHLIALKLAKRYNMPWVADFRDPWAYAYFNSLIWPLKLLGIRLERKVLAIADQITLALPGITREFKTVWNKFDLTKCFAILNGYDEEDFKDISPHIFKQFTILYAGTTRQTVLSPENLFVALDLLFQDRPALKSKIRVVFVGTKAPFVIHLIKKYNLDNCVEFFGYLEHKTALAYICGASVLFLLTNETKNAQQNPVQDKGMIPAKLYEYLRAKRPILALVPEDSDCAQIIRATQSGTVVRPKNHQKAKEVILNMYEKYIMGELRLESNHALIQQYERKVLTGKLANIFDTLLTKTNVKK